MTLDSTQDALLLAMADAAQASPQRQPFFCFGIETSHNFVVSHPGIPHDFEEAYPGDLETLQSEGHIRTTPMGHRKLSVDLTARGVDYASQLRRRTIDPITHVEENIMSLLEPGTLNARYPVATRKWEEARKILSDQDAANHLSTIGHLCRECLQEFSFALAAQRNITIDRREIASTVKTFNAILDSIRVDRAFFQALLAYWGTLSDLIQRQEHAGAKEGRPVTLSDAKRVVFHTALVMYELDQVAGVVR